MLDIIWSSTKTCGCCLRYIYIDVWHYPVLWEHVIRCISIMYNDMNISTLVAKEDLVNFHIMSSVSTVPKALCDFSYLTRSVSSAFFVPSIRTSASLFSNSAIITRMLKYVVIFWGMSSAIVTFCALLGLVFYNHPCMKGHQQDWVSFVFFQGEKGEPNGNLKVF